MSGSNNLNLPQMDDSTQGKSAFLNDMLALVDQSVTAALAIDASASTALTSQAIQNYAKLVADNVPAGGTTVTLGPVTKTFILANDKASSGVVTFACGTSSVAIPAGKLALVYMDGTTNGLAVVSSASAAATALSALSDVNVAEGAGIDGYMLTWNQSTGKWIATAPSTGGGGGGGGGGTPTVNVVQSGAETGGNPVVMGVAPTSGNLLIAMTQSFGDPGSAATGWTNLGDYGGGNDGIALVYRIADGTEGVNLVASSGHDACVIWEVTGFDTTKVPSGIFTAHGMNEGPAAVTTTTASELVLGYIGCRDNSGSGSNLTPLTVPTGTTADAASNDSHHSMAGYHIKETTPGTYNYAGTYPSGAQGYYGNVAIPLLSASASGALRALSDVDVPANPTNGYVLTWNSTEGKWNASAPPSGGGGGGGGGISLEKAFVAPPAVSTFTLQNPDATHTHAVDLTQPTSGAMLYEDAFNYGNTNALRALLVGIPGAHWDLKMRLRRHSPLVNYSGWGFVMRDSVGGKSMIMGQTAADNGWGELQLNSDTSYSGDGGLGGFKPGDYEYDFWIRAVNDATNFRLYMSRDGLHWAQLMYYNDSTANGFFANAPDHIGFGYSPNNSDNGNVAADVTCFSWELAAA